MKTLGRADSNYLLEQGLEKLHQESIQWISELDFWKNELHFFQKLLDANSGKMSSIKLKKKLEQFQNLIIYYSGELIDAFINKTSQHEKLLAEDLYEPSEMDEPLYRKSHEDLKEEISALRDQFYKYKKDFFKFIEPFI